MTPMLWTYITFIITLQQVPLIFSYDVWNDIPCTEEYQPDNCDFDKLDPITVDDFDRCGPARLDIDVRNFVLGASGRRQTYKENKEAFRRLKIIPQVLKDLNYAETKTYVLGQEIDFPVGISPVGGQGLAHVDGELATLEGISNMKTIMILSSFSSVPIELLAERAKRTPVHLWMQTYIFSNRNITRNIVKKAERQGYKAIVVTGDGNIDGTISCRARKAIWNPSIKLTNLGDPPYNDLVDRGGNFWAIREIVSWTKLPVVVKGIQSAEDAAHAIKSGASAIYVSNHGGRQFDGGLATIDALPAIVETVNRINPKVEVYLDSGVRSGYDVLKALARGAKMVFIGRPVVWGLAINGSGGVTQMMTVLKKDFQEAMMLSGNTSPSQINGNYVVS